MRRRKIAVLAVVTVASLLVLAVSLRSDAREPYRPRFVGGVPAIERHRDLNPHVSLGRINRYGETRIDVYRVPSDFDRLVTMADAELRPLGWQRKPVAGHSVVWALTRPEGEHRISMGDVRELERRSKRLTSAPRDGRPYVLVLVSTPEQEIGLLEQFLTAAPPKPLPQIEN